MFFGVVGELFGCVWAFVSFIFLNFAPAFDLFQAVNERMGAAGSNK